MTKEEIIKFLKENLSVDINLYIDRCYDEHKLHVTATVLIGEEEICKAKDFIDIPNGDCFS